MTDKKEVLVRRVPKRGLLSGQLPNPDLLSRTYLSPGWALVPGSLTRT